jgi:hypothetical protein
VGNVKTLIKALKKDNWVNWKTVQNYRWESDGKKVVNGLRVIVGGQMIYAQHLLEILKLADCEYVKILPDMENTHTISEKFKHNFPADKPNGNTWTGISITPVNSDVRWRAFLRGNRYP